MEVTLKGIITNSHPNKSVSLNGPRSGNYHTLGGVGTELWHHRVPELGHLRL